MVKLFMGGSPCTHWSIAQTKNRETTAEGLGWELFKNYLIGLDKYNPDYFLYENNKSMAPAIREQITKELGVEPIMINSALVSAQNRQRLYWTNIPGVTQPQDKGIMLVDILESGVAWTEKGYCLTTRCQGAIPEDTLKRSRHTMVAEPIEQGNAKYLLKNFKTNSEKANTLTASCYKGIGSDGMITVAEPISVLNINPSGNGMNGAVMRTDSKSRTLTTNKGEGPKIIEPVPAVLRYERTEEAKRLRRSYESGEIKHGYHEFHELHPRLDGKSNTVTTVLKDNMVIDCWDGKTYPVYEVTDGHITIKGKTYPIKLPDGFYIIRKLTVTECKRLQTVPDDYIFPVSNSQAYKMLGNGWTVDVIAHILSHSPRILTESVNVLSMYDGMSCGRIALNKLGADVARYHATEIDKYAIQTTQHNFPDTIQLGDAFQVRESGWSIK